MNFGLSEADRRTWGTVCKPSRRAADLVSVGRALDPGIRFSHSSLGTTNNLITHAVKVIVVTILLGSITTMLVGVLSMVTAMASTVATTLARLSVTVWFDLPFSVGLKAYVDPKKSEVLMAKVFSVAMLVIFLVVGFGHAGRDLGGMGV